MRGGEDRIFDREVGRKGTHLYVLTLFRTIRITFAILSPRHERSDNFTRGRSRQKSAPLDSVGAGNAFRRSFLRAEGRAGGDLSA